MHMLQSEFDFGFVDLDLPLKGNLASKDFAYSYYTGAKASQQEINYMQNNYSESQQQLEEDLDKDFTLQAFDFFADKITTNKRETYESFLELIENESVNMDGLAKHLVHHASSQQLNNKRQHSEIASDSTFQLPELVCPAETQLELEPAVKKSKTERIRRKRELNTKTTTQAISMSKKKSQESEKKLKKLKPEPCIKFVPEFITSTLRETEGEGRFTTCELMSCLLFGYTESLKTNSYATIKELMGNQRSRGSVRRKIEKIVKKETGINGGLLGIDTKNQKVVLGALWKRFIKLAEETEVSGTDSEKLFAKRIKAFAIEHCKIH